MNNFVSKEDRAKFETGDFSMVNFYDLIENYDYKAIDSIIDGAFVQNNMTLLYLIVMQINKVVQDFHLELYSDNYLKEMFHYLTNDKYSGFNIFNRKYLEEIVSNMLFDEFVRLIYKILKKVYVDEDDVFALEIKQVIAESPIEKFRIYASIFSDNPEIFLNDESARVRKIAHIKINFPEKFNQYSDDERMLIEILAEAIRIGEIKIITDRMNGLNKYGNYQDDLMYVHVMGLINGMMYDFDQDVYDLKVKDVRILANLFYDYLLEGKLEFVSGLMPACYKRIIDKKKVKVL